MNRITYWLWYGSQIVSSLRAEEGLSENEIKRRALEWNERIPLVEPNEAPFERAIKIRHAEIRIYPQGN